MMAMLRISMGRDNGDKRLRDGDSASEALGVAGLRENRANPGAGRGSYSGEIFPSRWGSAGDLAWCVLRRARSLNQPRGRREFLEWALWAGADVGNDLGSAKTAEAAADI